MRITAHVVRALTRIRDARLVWDVMGSMYNRRIVESVDGLVDRVGSEVHLPSGGRLLDVGCGRGDDALHLARDNPDAEVTGIDFSPVQVRAARRLQRQTGISNCHFERANVMNLPFVEQTFDVAVSIGSVKHWPDAVRGLGEIRRVLEPDGILVVSDTDRCASDDDIRLFMSRFRVWFVPDRVFFWGLRRVIFGQSFTQQSLADAISEAGFTHIESVRVADPPYVIAKATKQDVVEGGCSRSSSNASGSMQEATAMSPRPVRLPAILGDASSSAWPEEPALWGGTNRRQPEVTTKEDTA